MRALFLIISLMLGGFSAMAGNTVDDSFGVKKIEQSEAVIHGKVSSLNPGDTLFFIRPPYQFKVKSVNAATGEAVVELPAQHDLQVGNALLKNPTPQIKKFIQTESRLKEALTD